MAATAAAVNVTATKATKPTRTRVSRSVGSSVPGWAVCCSHQLDWLKPSKAVEPSSTATTATRPRSTGVASRLASGLRSTGAPSRRPHGDNRATRPNHTSNGSARANQVLPNTADPTSITATYSRHQVSTVDTNAESGSTSSVHTKANRPSAAGQ